MKKFLFCILFSFLLIPGIINAASANVSISAPSSVYVGDSVTVNVTVSSGVSLGSWQYNIGYDDSKLSYVSTTANSAQSVVGYAQGGGQSSVTYSWTFKATSAGSASFSVSGIDVYAFDDESQMSIGGTTSTSINVVKPSAPSSGGNSGGSNTTTQYKYSDDNNLSSLNIEGFELSFDSSVTEYSITVPNETKKVNIGATANDGKASVNGIGEYDVKEGNNDIEVVVTAENGDKKTYKVTVVVKELSPIEVDVDGKKYNVVRKKDKLPSANSTYKESSILIKGESVPCYHSDITDIYLVGLMNDKGEISFYRYDASKDKFDNYNEINVSGLFISLIDGADALNGYSNGTVKIGEKEYNGFVKDGFYSLLYGINLETGEKNYYSYDSSENTLQKYSSNVGVKNNNYFYIIIALAGLCVFEFFMIILSVVSKNKQLKKILHSKLDKKTEYEKSLESENTYNDEDNITDDLTDEYMSSDSNDDLNEEDSSDLENAQDSDKSEEVNEETNEEVQQDDDEYNLGHTALISRDLNNVFNNSVNKKELRKREKEIKKKRKNKNNDDEMFKF